MVSNDNLENLLRTGGLKAEPADRKECEGLLRSAIDRLQDAHNPALSFASRYRGLSPIVLTLQRGSLTFGRSLSSRRSGLECVLTQKREHDQADGSRVSGSGSDARIPGVQQQEEVRKM